MPGEVADLAADAIVRHEAGTDEAQRAGGEAVPQSGLMRVLFGIGAPGQSVEQQLAFAGGAYVEAGWRQLQVAHEVETRVFGLGFLYLHKYLLGMNGFGNVVLLVAGWAGGWRCA